MSEWSWYFAALQGVRGDFDARNPPSGYFRSRDRSLALWRDDTGKLQWLISSGITPRHLDQLCDTFAFFAPNPITYEVWEKHRDTGIWPEDPAPEIEAARAPAGIGHNNPPAEMVILDELATIRSAFDTWLASIGGTVSDEAHDAKVEAFTDRVAALKKQAVASHKVEKQPWLDGGREVDRRWDAAKDRTDAEQRAIAGTALAYRLKRSEERKEADRKARETLAEARRAGSANAPPPIAQLPRKQPSGLRTVKGVAIDDLPAVLAWLGAQPIADPKLLTAVRASIRFNLERGETIPGARLTTEQVAA